MSEPRAPASATIAGPAAAIKLRQGALQQLNLPRPNASGDATAALAVLHQLASSPATAADALALLHELQLHQVELALQAEQLSETRAELENQLQRLKDQHDALPAGCFTIDAQLQLSALNQRGAALLGLSRQQALAQTFSNWLAPASILPLREAMARIDAGQTEAGCRLMLLATDGQAAVWQAGLARGAASGHYLLNLLRCDEPGTAQ